MTPAMLTAIGNTLANTGEGGFEARLVRWYMQPCRYPNSSRLRVIGAISGRFAWR